jgi:hypothetical protein
MALRWTAAAMHEAKKGFRRLKAFKQLPAAAAARRLNWHARCLWLRCLCRSTPGGRPRPFLGGAGSPSRNRGRTTLPILARHSKASNADDYRRGRVRGRHACRRGHRGVVDAAVLGVRNAAPTACRSRDLPAS